MKISIEEIGKEMAELIHLAMAFDDAHIEKKNCGSFYYSFSKAHNEAFNKFDSLKHFLINLQPQNLNEILIMTLLAANYTESLRNHEINGNQFVSLEQVEPIAYLLDGLINALEKEAGTTREKLGLDYLRCRNEDKTKLLSIAKEALTREKTSPDKEEKAA